MNKLKKIPKFKSIAEEKKFWGKHDSSDYLDWSKARLATLPNLKPSLKTISLRLPEHLLNALMVIANKEDVPYQSLIKIILAERVQEIMR